LPCAFLVALSHIHPCHVRIPYYLPFLLLFLAL
jgi:hypothetical protein